MQNNNNAIVYWCRLIDRLKGKFILYFKCIQNNIAKIQYQWSDQSSHDIDFWWIRIVSSVTKNTWKYFIAKYYFVSSYKLWLKISWKFLDYLTENLVVCSNRNWTILVQKSNEVLILNSLAWRSKWLMPFWNGCPHLCLKMHPNWNKEVGMMSVTV